MKKAKNIRQIFNELDKKNVKEVKEFFLKYKHSTLVGGFSKEELLDLAKDLGITISDKLSKTSIVMVLDEHLKTPETEVEKKVAKTTTKKETPKKETKTKATPKKETKTKATPKKETKTKTTKSTPKEETSTKTATSKTTKVGKVLKETPKKETPKKEEKIVKKGETLEQEETPKNLGEKLTKATPTETDNKDFPHCSEYSGKSSTKASSISRAKNKIKNLYLSLQK